MQVDQNQPRTYHFTNGSPEGITVILYSDQVEVFWVGDESVLGLVLILIVFVGLRIVHVRASIHVARVVHGERDTRCLLGLAW